MSTTDSLRSVLVVDDEAGIRSALQASFLRHGWAVKTASGVREATAAFEHGNFSLLLTDVRMRDGSGFDLMRQVRSQSPSTAVILLTAFGSVPEAVRSIQSGAVDYLMKPVSFQQLHKTAEDVLARAAGEITPGNEPLPTTNCKAPPEPPPPGTSFAEVQRRHLENTLALAQGNRTRAAEMLGISLRTMRNRIRQYGLPPRNHAARSSS